MEGIPVSKTLIILLLLVGGVPCASAGQPPERQPGLSVKISDRKLQISVDGLLRLAGGQPLFESKAISVTGVRESDSAFVFQTATQPVEILVKERIGDPIISFLLAPHGNQSDDGRHFLGLFFDAIPGFDRGVTLWRYKPWNCWTKPTGIARVNEMQDWDVQFFYWKYSDGMYGAAVPLSGQGYRTTLGQEGGKFGSKAVSLFDKTNPKSIPQMAIGFGRDPYVLFERLYEEGMKQMGYADNLRKRKSFPPILENIGWCTWNASEMGKNLNDDLLLRAARSFADGKFPIGWFLVDDGWFDQTDNRLNSLRPNKGKFPRGFQPVISSLKKDYHLKDVGVWHALNGYWQGINANSELGRRYERELFTWTEKIRPDQDSSATRSCTFISPYSAALPGFYAELHRFLKEEGFSFVKVDNQLIVERMAAGNFPIWEGAERYHAALNTSVAAAFNNTLINCMDMTADAYLNFGSTAVGRAVEDYFPYEKGETYDLQRGNAAAHVLQAVYNSLYFSQMVYPDFDHFQSHNPNAVFHAIARAINSGPVSITDNIGEQDFNVLFPLVYSDGKIVRADMPLLPTEDCLFQVQSARPLKAYSMAGNAGLLGIWNCADAESVKGSFSPSDVHGIKGEQFAVYEYFSKKLTLAGRETEVPVSLRRLGYQLHYVVPLVEGNAVIGLVNKYNAPGTVLQSTVSAKAMKATLYEGGPFAAVAARTPESVKVDGRRIPFTYKGGLITATVPLSGGHQRREVEIILQ